MSNDILSQVLANIKYGFNAPKVIDEMDVLSDNIKSLLCSDLSETEKYQAGKQLLDEATCALSQHHQDIPSFTIEGIDLLECSIKSLDSNLNKLENLFN